MQNYIHIEIVNATPYENIETDKSLNAIVKQGYNVVRTGNDENLTKFINEEEFERHYVSVDNMSSYHALYLLLNGYKVRRKAWDEHCYIMTCTMFNKIELMLYYNELDNWESHRFTMLNDDILANDWELYEEKTFNYKGVEIKNEE